MYASLVPSSWTPPPPPSFVVVYNQPVSSCRASNVCTPPPCLDPPPTTAPTATYPFFSPTFQHVPIRKKEKCPPSPPKDCSLKVGEGCKDCNERDCEWNDTDKKCLKECYDDDKCVRSKDRCPAVSSPLLRKGGVRQIHVGGLDLTR